MLVTLSRLCQCAGVSQVPARGPPGGTRMYRKDLLSPMSPAGLRNGIGKHESNAHDVSVCRGHMRSITCPNLELLHIFNAFYGKLSGHDCETPIAQFRDQMPTCFAKDAPNIIRQTCQGQQSCDLYAEDSLYNNPCPSVKKYLYVSFTCQGKSRLPEILKMFHEKQRAQRRYQIHQQEILKFAEKQREDAQKKSQLYLQQQKQQHEQQRLQDSYRQRQQLEQRQLATQELAIRKQQQAQRQMEQQAFAQRQQIAARKAEEKAREEEVKQKMLLQQRQQVAQQQQWQQRMQEQARQQMQQQIQRQQILAQHAAMPQSYASTMLRGSVTQPQRTNTFSFYPYQHMIPPPQPAPLNAPALPPMPAQAAIPLSSLTPQSAAAAGGYLRQFISQAPQYLRRTPVAHPALAGRPGRPQYLVRPQPAQARFLPQPKPQPKHATERYLSPLPPPPQLGRTGVPYAPPVPAKHAPPQAKTSVPLTSSVPVLPVTSIKYSPHINAPPPAPLLPKVVPQLPVARGALPPPGWQAKPDIKFYEKQVGNALNSLYRLYSNNKCDKCDGDCNNFRCWGCGGCALPSLEKHQTIAPWHPPTNDAATLDKRMLFNRVKEAMLRQHVNYYPPVSPPYQSPTSRSNVTQPLDAKKQYWTNQNTPHRGETFWPFYGKSFLGPFTPSLFKKQAQAYAAATRPPQFHRRAWSYQGKEWPHERNIPITRNMWLAVRDNVASNTNGVPADDQESVVRTADGLTFQYHDAFANNAMALSGLVLYPFPKRNKKKTIPIPPKRRTHEGSSFDSFDTRRSKVKRLPD
jgi:hypothetical protein